MEHISIELKMVKGEDDVYRPEIDTILEHDVQYVDEALWIVYGPWVKGVNTALTRYPLAYLYEWEKDKYFVVVAEQGFIDEIDKLKVGIKVKDEEDYLFFSANGLVIVEGTEKELKDCKIKPDKGEVPAEVSNEFPWFYNDMIITSIKKSMPVTLAGIDLPAVVEKEYANEVFAISFRGN